MFDLNFFLWAAQIALAGLFGLAGVMKSFRPIEALRPQLPWVEGFSPATVRFVGVAELAGAFGMILPMLTGILPWLTPLAAAGFIVVQVLAVELHIRRGEFLAALPINGLLTALSIFVLWDRFDLLV